MDPEPQTINQLWDEITTKLDGADLFYGHGATDSRSEAIWIISHCLKIEPTHAFDQLDNLCADEVIKQANKFAQTRINTKKPLAYILGEAWLMGVPFYSDERSIIPRSFIAELIADGTLDPWIPPGGRALDLCCGNGSLAILLALNCPDIDVSATDLSEPAIALAAKNLDRHHLSKRVDVYLGDLWEPLPEPNQENLFDLIICNPPYVNSDSMSKLPFEYQLEPNLALAGGHDGMDLIRKIISRAKEFLSPKGALVLEIGNEFEYFCQAFPDIPVTWIEVSAGDQQVALIECDDLP